MFDQLLKYCDVEQFNLFLQDPNYALYRLLGDHDNVFNECFLTFIGAAWDIRDSF